MSCSLSTLSYKVWPIFWAFSVAKKEEKAPNVHLSADLVAALASLDVHDFTHFVDLFHNVSHNLAMTEDLSTMSPTSLRGLSHRPSCYMDGALSNATSCRPIRARQSPTAVPSFTISDLIDMKSSYTRLCYRYRFLRQETGSEQKKYSRLK